MKPRYKEYLQSDQWRELREAKLLDVDNTCEKCRRKSCLEVHHLSYERLGQERLSDLQVLCQNCHYDEHTAQLLAKFPKLPIPPTPPPIAKKSRRLKIVERHLETAIRKGQKKRILRCKAEIKAITESATKLTAESPQPPKAGSSAMESTRRQKGAPE